MILMVEPNQLNSMIESASKSVAIFSKKIEPDELASKSGADVNEFQCAPKGNNIMIMLPLDDEETKTEFLEAPDEAFMNKLILLLIFMTETTLL